MGWITYALVLVAYYALHSIMASTLIKDTFQKIGVGVQSYRILFNLIALSTTYLVFQTYRSTPDTIDYDGYRFGYVVMIVGLMVLIRSLVGYDLLAFMGAKKETIYDALNTSGLNQYVRHPLYLGIVILLIGWLIVSPTTPALCTFIVSVGYIYVGIYFEEKKLIAQFGETYLTYQKRIPKLIPRMKKAQK